MLAAGIAWRYLFSKKSHNAVNIISAISVAGVATATAAIVCVLSVFNGFKDLAAGRLSLIDPDIKVVASSQGAMIENSSEVIDRLTAMEEVDHAVALLEGQALAMFRNSQQAVSLIGTDLGFEYVCNIDSAVIDGVYMSYTAQAIPLAALSVGSAIELNARPGLSEPLTLFAPRRIGRISAANTLSAFRADTLMVSAVWQVEQAERDAATMIVPIASARKIFDRPLDSASAIALRLKPSADPSKTASRIVSLLGQGFTPLTRLQQEETAFRMIEIEKWITFLMLAFILVIASFNVVSTLSMLIIEKRSDMQTLRFLGASPASVGRIFMWEGWMIAMLGGLAGIIVGAGLSLAQQWGGFIKLHGDPSKLTVSAYPVALEGADLVAVLLLVALIGLLTGLLASRMARR